MEWSKFFGLLILLPFFSEVFSQRCNLNCENDAKKICGTTVKPKNYDTIRTFNNECFMKKHNCENPKDGK